MRSARRVWVLVLAGLAIAASSGAQPPVESHDKPNQGAARTIELSMIVRGQDGAPAGDLQTGSLTFFDEGKPRPVDLTRPPDRQNVLLVLPYDAGHGRKSVIDQAIQLFEPEDRLVWNVSVLDCDGLQSAYSDDKATVLEVLRQARKSDIGRRALYEADWQRAVLVSIAQMHSLAGRRGVLMLDNRLFDPGEDGDERLGRQALAGSLQIGGAQLYVKGGGDWRGITDHVPVRIKTVKDAEERMLADRTAYYLLRFVLAGRELNGLRHHIRVKLQAANGLAVSISPQYYAPSRHLESQLADAPAVLREALERHTRGADGHDSVTALATGVQIFPSTAYFPTGRGAASAQVLMAGIEWMAHSAPPVEVEVLAELSDEVTGRMLAVYRERVPMRDGRAVWQVERSTGSGLFTLQIAAMDGPGKALGTGEFRFVNEADPSAPVRVSSLVLGRRCEFQAPPETEAETALGADSTVARSGKKMPKAGSAGGDGNDENPEAVEDALAGGRAVDPLLQLHCRLAAEPSGLFSSTDVVWAMARLIPQGGLGARPAEDWKAQFFVRAVETGKKAPRKPVDLVSTTPATLVVDAGPGYLAAAALPLAGIPEVMQLEGNTGQFEVVLRLTGPGIEKFVEQSVPITVYPPGN